MITEWCTTCDTAVIQTYLTPNYNNIMIQFPIPVSVGDFEVSELYNPDFCKAILTDFDTMLFGYKPSCKFLNSE